MSCCTVVAAICGVLPPASYSFPALQLSMVCDETSRSTVQMMTTRHMPARAICSDVVHLKRITECSVRSYNRGLCPFSPTPP